MVHLNKKIGYAMEKIWMPVRDYINYEVSNYGDVRNARTGRVLKLSGYGYYQVHFWKDGKRKMFLVHRLVYEAFNGPIPDGLVIDHVDGCKTNNRLENLRVCTQKENSNNPVTRTRLIEAMRKRSQSAEWRKNHADATRKSHNKSIVQIDKTTGETIKRFECAMDASRELGISFGNISECCTGKRNSAGGFRWTFFMPPSVIYKYQGLGS